MPYHCSIWNKAPDYCKEWLPDEGNIHFYPNCSYYFVEGKIQGECNRCGDCCAYMRWVDDVKTAEEINADVLITTTDTLLKTTPLTFENRHERDIVCRFLKEVV